MTGDARFEDGGAAPLRLWAQDADDLLAISALVQDAVFPVTEMRWQRSRRRFAILLNRFRWEDAETAARRARPFERVQSLLTVENVGNVKVQGVNPGDRDQVLSLLSLAWEMTDAPSGRLILTLAGDGALGVEAEALEVTLRDVTRPYVAPSGRAPKHPL